MTEHQHIPAPTTPDRSDDWWDTLYAKTAEPAAHIRGGARYDWRTPAGPLTNTPPAAEPEPEPEESPAEHVEESGPAPAVDRPGWLQPQPGYYPAAPAILPTVQKAPTALSPKSRALLYNATAATAGWGLGLYDLCHTAIQECGAEAGIGTALLLGIGSCIVLAHLWDRRTRHWWVGLAWSARIPLATAITALALYAPASQI